MSCDYGVWHSDKPLTNDEATKIYIALCDLWPFLEGEKPSVRTFYDELTKRWPELDTVPDEKVDDKEYCPWSCAISHSGMAVVTACVWPMADKVGQFIQQLAAKHRLVFYDPQSERLVLPEHLSALQDKKSSWIGRLFDRSGN